MHDATETRRKFLARAISMASLSLNVIGGSAGMAEAGELGQHSPFFLQPGLRHRLPGSDRKVFAHWHFFPISFDNKPADQDYYSRNFLNPEGENSKYLATGGMIRERPFPRAARLGGDWLLQDMTDDLGAAARIGIDAFQFNISNFSDVFPYRRYLDTMLKAISAGSLPIKVMPCLDCTGAVAETPPEQLADFLTAWTSEPGLMRAPDGRIYLSAFRAELWSIPRWAALLSALRDKGWRPYFFPILLDAGETDPALLNLSDMVSIWSGDTLGSVARLGTVEDSLANSRRAWCEPIWPQDFRPKVPSYTEAENSLLFRRGWEQAIVSKSRAVNILTWNDYSEGSEIRPSTGIKCAYYDLAAYYIAWYKSGMRPTITQDTLYYFYRIERSSGASLGTAQSQPFALRGTSFPKNDIELLSFLTKPGLLTIRTSEGVVAKTVPAGMSSLRAPLSLGKPNFELWRDGTQLISMEGEFTVRSESLYQDLLYRAGSSRDYRVTSGGQ